MQGIDDGFIPATAPLTEREVAGFGRRTFWVGMVLIFLGAMGIALPPLLAITTVDLVSLVLLLGGGFWLWHAWAQAEGHLRWFKPLILVVAGLLMLASPTAGAAALALLLSFYLMLDAFGSFALAHELRPRRGWGWMAINAVMDLLLVAFFTFSWPASSVVVVGLFVGVSLVFDGVALTAMGAALRQS